MALIVSAATGNFNAGATWVGGVVPTIGDEARASTGHTITITANATCDEVSNAGTGIFTLNDGITLTANVTNKTATASRACMQFTALSPAVGTIVGNVTSGPAASTIGINNVNTGTVNITGNVTGGSASTAYGAYNSATGTITITGNATGGSGASSHAVQGQGNGTITITGNATGTVGFGANNVGTGTITIYGIATGGSSAVGINNASTGTVNLGRAKGNTYGPGNTSGLVATVGAANAGVGVIEIEQLEYGTFGQSPTSGTGIRLKKAGSNLAVFNFCDTAGAKTLIDATQNAAMPAATDVRSGVSYASGALTGTCAVPAAGSVALGVPVGAGFGTAVLTPEAVWGASTRTLTAGAGISASDVWDYATRSLTTSSGPTAVQIRQEMDSNSTKLANLDASISSRLATSGYTAPTSAPSVSDIRTELSVELGRLDASVSSRLASASYTAPTTPPTAAQIATAVEGSLLNEADGQAVLNAIVGAIGNTNLSEVSLVAAVRADLERNGGKLDSIPTDAAPSAASVATAVWSASTKEITGGTVTTLTNSPDVPTESEIAAQVRTELSVELGRIDAAVSSRLAPSGTLATVTTLTNAPTVPTAAAIADEVRVELATELARLDAPVSGATAPSAATVATAVRSELSVELARVDQAVSTRLAGSAYTAPANSDVAAIKTKTDAINVDRINNTATTAIVGNLLAQANS